LAHDDQATGQRVMLHPQATMALAAEATASTGAGSIQVARRRIDAAARAECSSGPDIALVDELPTGGVRCRRYHPAPGDLLPVVVYLHGGGWALGSLDTVDAVCRRVAERSGCAVLSVDYRLAPEHPWPAAVHDVDAVLDWIRANGGTCRAGRDRAGPGR
jgi:acetyl esterase